MSDNDKTKDELIRDLAALRRENALLKSLKMGENSGQTYNSMCSGEERYRAIVENQVQFVDRYLPGGKLTYVNKALAEYIGMRPEDLTGKSFYPFLHKDDLEDLIKGLDALSPEQPRVKLENRIILSNGSVRWHRWIHQAFFDKSGKVLEYQSVGEDITDIKQAEERLRQSEERYRLLFNNIIREAIFIHRYTPDELPGTFIQVNDVACQRYGYTHEEFLSMSPIDIDAPEGLLAIPHAMQKLKTAGCATWEGMHVAKNGRKIPVEIANVLFHDLGEPLILSAARDITERKQAEEEKSRLEAQLYQAQKMESIGQLSGGVAHDFNNILSAIVGYAHLTLMALNIDDPLNENIKEILSAANKASTLTQSLLAFSRKQVMDPKPVDLNDIVRKQKKFLTRLIREDIDFSVNLSKDALCIKADSMQIEQILMNLVTNARDSIAKGGCISIATERVQTNGEFTAKHGHQHKQGYALLSVSDSGEGMTSDIKEKIFEPFFTTKEPGKGTGLGLSMVYGLVKQHSGHINVESKLSVGSTFRICLPLIEQGAEKEEYKQSDSITETRGSETILIAEDDASLRKLLTTVLRNYGYKVLETIDGLDAVAQFETNRDSIDLVILDGIMPKKNGMEAYQEIKAITPSAKTIFLSGYAEDIISKEGLLDPGINYIQKPVSPIDLLLRVRGILEQE